MAGYLSRTVLGPLTTTFTPAPACSVYAHVDTKWPSQFYRGQKCNQGQIQDEPTCWPTATVKAPGQPIFGFGMYSPGLVCPHGYEPACSATAAPNGQLGSAHTSDFPFQYKLTAGETAIGCCPSGMTCDFIGGGVQTCNSQIIGGTISPAGVCSSAGSGYSTTGTATISPSAKVKAQAPLFQLVYQSSDLLSSSPAAASTIISNAASTSVSTATTTSTSTISTSSSSTSQNPTDTPLVISADTGLFNSAKIGIGVGVPIAVLLIAAIGFMLWMYRKEKRKNQQPIGLGQGSVPFTDKPVGYNMPPTEAPANVYYPYRHGAYRHGPAETNPPPHHLIAEM